MTVLRWVLGSAFVLSVICNLLAFDAIKKLSAEVDAAKIKITTLQTARTADALANNVMGELQAKAENFACIKREALDAIDCKNMSDTDCAAALRGLFGKNTD